MHFSGRPRQVKSATTTLLPALLALPLILFVATASQASTEADGAIEANSIETVTVSATPIAMDDAGSSVTIITREDILRRGSPSINALLRQVPGFAVSQSGSEGATSDLRVRGAEANQVLVLVDGIEANDPAQASQFDFSNLTTSDIERIEIVRGPQSALWGSDAMAGVIHIITANAGKPDGGRLNLAMEAGAFGTAQANLGVHGAIGSHSVKFNLDFIQSDGSNIARAGNEEDGLDLLTLGLTGRHATRDDIALSYAVRHTGSITEFDGTDAATGLPGDANLHTESSMLLAGASLTHNISHRLDQVFSLARGDTDNKNFTDAQQDSGTRATRDLIKYQFNVIERAHRLSLLLEHERIDFAQSGRATAFGDPNQNRSIDTSSLAAEYRYDNDRFNLSASIRQDSNSDFDNANAWRVTGKFHATPDLALHASLGKSIKNPTFTERFGFFTNFQGNPNLKPETSRQWELGLRAILMARRLNLALTGFAANLENEINGFAFDAATGGFTAVNKVQDSKRQGVEAELGWTMSDSMDMALAYTYLDATEEMPNGRQEDELRRPQHIASLTLNRSWARAGLNLALNHTGEQDDNYFPPYPQASQRKALAAYTLLSLNGIYQVNPSLKLTLRLENLLDESYEQVYGYASPGFGAYLGLRVSL